MKSYSLNGLWKLYCIRDRKNFVNNPSQLFEAGLRPIEAEVPGNVELDFIKAGLLPEDLFFADNVKAVRSLETCEYWYVRDFDTPGGCKGKTSLVLDGVDTIAEYWLNGIKIGRSENMFIEQEFDVTGLLKSQGANKLCVHILSSLAEASRYKYDSSLWALGNNWEQLWLRKAAHSFGWDIMPRVLSAGLWRGVNLVVLDEMEISELNIYTYSLAQNKAVLNFDYQIKAETTLLPDLKIRITGVCGDSSFEKTKRLAFTAGEIKVQVENPKLWWPNGYGSPSLYEVRVELLLGEKVVAQRDERIGLRTTELITRDNLDNRYETGEFLIKINGQPIMCKGSNWVPADVFHSKDSEKYQSLLQLFIDQNCNILRCWGGNVYEDHAFFDICDEKGIMVWQDFALACACYPQTQEFFDVITAEAASVIKKLRNHPSLVIWCGDNECDEFYYHRKNLDPGKNKISREVLPAVLFRYDPYRPYIPSSPYYSPAVISGRDLDIMPEQHLWDFRDYYKNTYFSKTTASFISELGYIACPGLSSIKRFIDEEHLWPWKNNSQWLLHATEPTDVGGEYSYRIEIIDHQIKEMFGRSEDNLEDFILLSQIAQAEACKFFIEMVRLAKWRRTGIIVWNMIDGWPQFSDSVVDYYGVKKLAWYYMKRVQEPFCIMIGEPSDGYADIIGGNDSLELVEGNYEVVVADSKQVLAKGQFTAAANENTKLGKLRVYPGEQSMLLIRWSIGDKLYGNHYLLGYPPFSFDKYKKWMKDIALLQEDFTAEQIGK